MEDDAAAVLQDQRPVFLLAPVHLSLDKTAHRAPVGEKRLKEVTDACSKPCRVLIQDSLDSVDITCLVGAGLRGLVPLDQRSCELLDGLPAEVADGLELVFRVA
jgi:hypothetical protein